MLGDAKKFWRFATGLRRFLRTPLTPEDCRRIVAGELRCRERTFLLLVKRAVYEFPLSPYKPMLAWAGVDYGDLE